MNPLRYLCPECIELDLPFEPTPVPELETPAQAARRVAADKEAIIRVLVAILDRSGTIVNPSKLFRDMRDRERKATTGIAPGIAIPHVRSLQARQFVMGFARARGDGVPFDSLDGSPTRLFFLLASPPYDDKLYLRIYSEFAEMLLHDWVRDALLAARTPQDIINIMRGFITQ